MKGRRLWLKLEVHGSTIPVYVVKELEDEDGHDLDGWYAAEKPAIFVRQMDNIQNMKSTLHHELLHVCFLNWPGTEAKEEQIIRFLEPVQFDLLIRNKWLRYPNPPKVK